MNDLNLKELQRVELEILKEFIRVCNILNVKYYLDGGTMLGAIRHGGFIPWDDDIDVFMLRKDYEKFIKKAPKLIKKNYFLQTYDSDKNYINNFAKMRDDQTTYIEKTTKNLNINHGAYIDIFIYDNYDFNKKAKNFFDNSIIRFYNLKLYKNYYVVSFKRKIKRCFSIILTLFSKKTCRILQKKDEIFKIYYNKNDCQYLRQFSSIYPLEKAIFKKEWLGNGVLMKFEDIEAYVPENYDMWLKTIYGDYMKLPPKEKRKPHHDYEIMDLNKPYTEYISKKGEI